MHNLKYYTLFYIPGIHLCPDLQHTPSIFHQQDPIFHWLDCSHCVQRQAAWPAGECQRRTLLRRFVPNLHESQQAYFCYSIVLPLTIKRVLEEMISPNWNIVGWKVCFPQPIGCEFTYFLYHSAVLNNWKFYLPGYSLWWAIRGGSALRGCLF